MILLVEPWINKEEAKQLKRVIDSTFVTEHDLTKEFELLTKNLTGSSHAISIANGTLALFASMKALDIGPGDEVIVPNITFAATANAVILAGATPILSEVSEKTFCMNADAVSKNITSRTKALIPVHLYGQSPDMNQIMKLAEENSIYVIEDAAQGVGVSFQGKHAGTFGDLGVLSYYGNKTITTGEGGMVLTKNKDLAKRVYQLKNHGRSEKGTFIHETIGYNFSFTEMQAAIGIAQMTKLKKIKEKKRKIFEYYSKKLEALKEFIEPQYFDKRVDPVYWLSSFMCSDVEGLSKFLLEKHDIQTRRAFYPLHLQPCYQKSKVIPNIKDDFPISLDCYQKFISLPSAYYLDEQSIDKVIHAIKAYYENRY